MDTNFANYFQLTANSETGMSGHYNFYLVALSYVIAVFASYVAFEIASGIRKSIGKKVFWQIAAGSFAMGAGIFSMHFIGMLAFIMPMRMNYEVPLTLLSLIVPIVASGFTLNLIKPLNVGNVRLITGGTIFGIAIASMHYIGMDAMVGVKIYYRLGLFIFSILFAIAASILALWLMLQCDKGTAVRQRFLKVLSAFIMGSAICGMHYIGMSAAVFVPVSEPATRISIFTQIPLEQLSFLIAFITALIMTLSLVFVAYRQSIVIKLLMGYLIIIFVMISSTFIPGAIFSLPIIAGIILLAVVISLILSFQIAKPINTLKKSAEDLANGTVTQKIVINSEDEVGELAKSFNKMIDSLAQSQNKRNELMGVVAHDLRNPLSIIIAGSSIMPLIIKDEDLKKLENIAVMIHKAGKQMLSLIDNLLVVNAFQAGDLLCHLIVVNLKEFSENTFSFNKLLYDQKGVILSLETSLSKEKVVFDENKITQVVNNFLSNALKFSRPGSHVKLIVSEKETKLRIEVHDEAGGIPEKEQKRIFKKIPNLTPQPTGNEPSHGLGLAICKDLIEANQGTIGFKSTYGKGSVFYFEIPIFDPEVQT